MAPHARILAAAAIATTLFIAPLVAHHSLKHDIYVYDLATRTYIVDAVVTVSYTGGSQTAVTEKPHGNVQFRLPGELESAQFVVTHPEYCTFDGSIGLGHRPHVGGRGLWIGLTACESSLAAR